MKHNKLVFMLQCAIFAALICIFAPISFSLGVIPVTLGLFAVLLCGVVLPWQQSLIAVVLYIALSLCGLPVCSHYTSGLTAIPGPTGGYILSYLLVAPVVSLLWQKTRLKKLSFFGAFLACAAGVVICYAIGTAHFMILNYVRSTPKTLKTTLEATVFGFIGWDVLKSAIVAAVGVPIRSILIKSKLLRES